MEEKFNDYMKNPAFNEFLNQEFNSITVDITSKEMAEFAYGSLENAIKEFERKNPRKRPTRNELVSDYVRK